ncbi:YigZ family protein [Salinibacterium sp. SWN1162]|uniref:IMPACT family protein n=1 Tax=Salinibacterium sp. SWN1162 TaxID=2792053 RepID=UPI0018CF5D72|nr:YigZ family protein [Salinibacterium sp. SWN1162]MBH0010225.1 YigZ family protein [Salinibacterium sp. SWN1162]
MPEFTLRGGPGASIHAELEAKRSRFLCTVVRVATEDDARDVIELARKTHWDARHHCSAFVLGSTTEPSQVRRSNDDGEPSGTAGRPILDVLTGRNLIDCVAVVSRYFGGTLLGTGGLIRAYSDAAAHAVDAAREAHRLVARERRDIFHLSLGHADAGRIEAELRHQGITVLGTDYGARAVLTLATDAGSTADLSARVAAVTAGAARIEPAGSEWVDAEPE